MSNEEMKFASPFTASWMLRAAEELPEIGSSITWQAISGDQRRFLELHSLVQGLPRPQGLDTKAVRDPQLEELKAWLREKGIAMENLQRTCREGDVWFGALLKALTHWRVQGTRAKMGYQGQTYPAVEMKFDREGGIHLYQDSQSRWPVVGIEGDNGYMVFLQEVAGPAQEFMPMIGQAQTTISSMRSMSRRDHNYTGIRWPMLDGDGQYTRDWMIGLTATRAADGLPVIITQVYTRGILKANDKGAAFAIADVAMGMRGAKPKEQWYELNHTGCIRITFLQTHPEKPSGIVSAVFDVPARFWKDPGDLKI